MQILDLKLNHFNLFCPATGQHILSEEGYNEDAISAKGYWISDIIAEPILTDKALEKSWETFYDNNEDLDIEAFL